MAKNPVKVPFNRTFGGSRKGATDGGEEGTGEDGPTAACLYTDANIGV